MLCPAKTWLWRALLAIPQNYAIPAQRRNLHCCPAPRITHEWGSNPPLSPGEEFQLPGCRRAGHPGLGRFAHLGAEFFSVNASPAGPSAASTGRRPRTELHSSKCAYQCWGHGATARTRLRHKTTQGLTVNAPALLKSDVCVLDDPAPLHGFVTKKIAELLG